jgi:hypothetical protein
MRLGHRPGPVPTIYVVIAGLGNGFIARQLLKAYD